MSASPSRDAPATATPIQVVVPLWAKMIAGGVAGIVGTSIIFPLDLVKTLLQGQSGAPGTRAYAGPIDCFKKVVAKNGVSGLYSGLKPNLIGVFPEKALKLSVNDTVREYFTRSNGDGKIKLWQEILSGGTAGLIQVAVTNPMEIVKLRMQMNVEDGIKRSTSETVKELGARGLYRAITACWLRDVPFSFIFFPLAANLKTAFNGDESLLGLFTASALAGSIAAGVVTPFDVIKTNRQKRGGDTAFSGNLDCMRKVQAQFGWSAFARGLVPRMIVQAPLFGCTLLAYEILKAIYYRKAVKAAAAADAQRV